jgi:hypothetical protein
MSQDSNDRAATSRTPQDLFTDLFTQVFGLEKTLLLVPEYPAKDIYEGSRFIDFDLRTTEAKIAFEIDGTVFHVPEATPVAKYEDDLLRQNSLIHQGWRVFRWTDRQIAHEPERVKQELALFLEQLSGLLSFDDFLPRQSGEIITLREHQDEALLALQKMREASKTIALLDHATGVGKTVTAITDARRLGGRTLWLIHTRNLVGQTVKEFERLWPEAEAGRYYGGAHETGAYNLIGAIQSIVDPENWTTS